MPYAGHDEDSPIRRAAQNMLTLALAEKGEMK
jgi:hypothetical protein